MGKPTTHTSPRYRDDPEASEAHSLHATPDDYEYDDVAQLPSYEDSESAAAESTSSGGNRRLSLHQQRQDAEISEPVDPYPRIRQRSTALRQMGTKILNTNETTVRMNKRLMEPETLQEYVQNHLRVTPPRPCFRVVGSHKETRYNASSKKTEQERIVDFDITLSLHRYLGKPPDRRFWLAYPATDGDKTYRGSWRRTRAKEYNVHDVERSVIDLPKLGDWCRDFCGNKSALKVFRVSHIVDGLDVAFVKQSLERIIRSTHYHGNINLAYHVEEANVDVYSPHWINRMRLSPWRWIFYVTFLWIFTWPILFFLTKRWEVYAVRWNWFHQQADDEEDQQQPRRAHKVFATIGEQRWVELHENLIMSLVLENFQGDATDFPNDVPDERVRRAMGLRMPQQLIVSGDGQVDAAAAANLVQSSRNMWNAMQGRQGIQVGGGAWGGDC